MEIREFQELIARLYLEPDSARGLEGTYMWFAEEVGELTRDLRRGAPAEELALDVVRHLQVCRWKIGSGCEPIE